MTTEDTTKTTPVLSRHWAHDIHGVFKQQKISMVSYVPDAGHVALINLCQADPEIRTVSLTTEEEGVAFAAGAYLGGQRAALLMQSSGVGNCINMFSLIKTCGFPFLAVVTMRGEWGEFNPWQVTMGLGTPAALGTVGVDVFRADHADDVRDVTWAAAKLAFDSYRAVAVLLSQQLIGAKLFQG